MNAGFTRLELVLSLLLVGCLGAVLVPVNWGWRGDVSAFKAVNNSQRIVEACRIFANDHDGVFPDATQPKQIAAYGAAPKRPTITRRNSSSAQFQLLINSGDMPSESVFFVAEERDGAQPLKPANDHLGGRADLNEKTNAWSYWRGLRADGAPSTPLVFTRSKQRGVWPTKGHVTGEGGRWNGRIVVARVDGSAALVPLTEGKAREGGQDIFLSETWSLGPKTFIALP